MVMYHPEISYADAQSRGRVQQTILEELSRGIDDSAQVELAKADTLVRTRLAALDMMSS
jgi:hypothetical protein